MNDLTNDIKHKSKSYERPNMYGHINYIHDEIVNIYTIIAKPAIQLAPFAGKHQHSP